MNALIDADIVLHRVGYTTNEEEEWVARARTDEMLDGILVDTSSQGFELYLSDARENNFRTALSPAYKANRPAARPKHYDAIKTHLIREWSARITNEMEADDALGIAQDKTGCETVICTIDKDLLQIPGQHYNFVKKEWASVTRWEGLKWFYKQILIGDTSDNVQGCSGIGFVKAGKALDPISESEGEQALFQCVLGLYQKQAIKDQESLEEVLNRILLAGRLLKIKQEEQEPLWHFPQSSPMLEPLVSSTQPVLVASTPYTELTILEKLSGSQPLGQSTVSTSPEDHPALT